MNIKHHNKPQSTKYKDDPFFDRVKYYQEQMLNKEALMGYLAILAQKTIRKTGMDPDDFSLNNMFALSFISGDMDFLMHEEGQVYFLVFQNVSEEKITCVSANATLADDGDIVAYTQIHRLEDYRSGNRGWVEDLLGEDGKLSGQVQDAGEDYYELEYILRNDDLKWINEAEQGLLEEDERNTD